MAAGSAPVVAKALSLRTVASIDAVAASDWDRCAGAGDPFLSHAFLRLLERSGSATAETGWLPRHLLAEDRAGRLVGAVPAYLKSHSLGEYVFDWGWAEGYDRAGIAYYPKLQASVPFSPVTGARLLVAPGADQARIRPLLLAGLVELTTRLDLSSAHVTFLTAEEAALGGEREMLHRQGVQFHWHNRGYSSFDEFLSALIARKRKAIRNERKRAAASGLAFRTLRGDEIRPEHWQALYRFYRNTCDRKWGRPYLTRAFFAELGPVLGERAVVTMAADGATPVAGALHLCGAQALYGRYWGAAVDARWLHFEICYYRAIELAIELGLERIEAGAQGGHKLQRGYVAVPTHSIHFIRHPLLRRAIDRAIVRETRALEQDLGLLRAESPYRADRAAARTGRDG